MIASSLWSMLGGEPALLDALSVTGDARVLPSVFDVTGFAAATIGVATLAAAELQAARQGFVEIEPVTVGTREACAAFSCEALFQPVGWDRVGVWDPIAGDYETADGWIRLHTNYASHRDAALRALGVADADREAVAAAVATWDAGDLEARVVDEGGAAAAMRTRAAWSAHPHGAAIATQTPIAVTYGGNASDTPLGPAARPLRGVKVLDLTRVLAGPFGTRFLAAWGADVLRIDPPGFAEVPAIVPEATAGKRTASLDLRSADDRARFEQLVADADVLVHGYRPGALANLGLDAARLRTLNASLIISEHDAYGWTGPWAARRGFDSLVQMSCGIAAARGDDRPRPLPCQALDHGTGFLLAAAVCRALTHHERTGAASDIRGALVGAANVLFDHPDPAGMDQPTPEWGDADLEDRATDFGPARAVPIPGAIGDERPRLDRPAGPLGRHEAAFS